MILPASIGCQFQFPPRKNWHFPLHRAGIGNAKQLHWHSRRGFKTLVHGEKGSLKKNVFFLGLVLEVSSQKWSFKNVSGRNPIPNHRLDVENLVNNGIN